MDRQKMIIAAIAVFCCSIISSIILFFVFRGGEEEKVETKAPEDRKKTKAEIDAEIAKEAAAKNVEASKNAAIALEKLKESNRIASLKQNAESSYTRLIEAQRIKSELSLSATPQQIEAADTALNTATEKLATDKTQALAAGFMEYASYSSPKCNAPCGGNLGEVTKVKFCPEGVSCINISPGAASVTEACTSANCTVLEKTNMVIYHDKFKCCLSKGDSASDLKFKRFGLSDTRMRWNFLSAGTIQNVSSGQVLEMNAKGEVILATVAINNNNNQKWEELNGGLRNVMYPTRYLIKQEGGKDVQSTDEDSKRNSTGVFKINSVGPSYTLPPRLTERMKVSGHDGYITNRGDQVTLDWINRTNDINQKWTITTSGFISVNGQQTALDSDGTNIYTSDFNGGDYQLWIQDTGNKFFNFATEKYISHNGTKLIPSNERDGKELVILTESQSNGADAPEIFDKIIFSENTKKCLESGDETRVSFERCNNSDGQKWNFKGNRTIINKSNGRALDTDGGRLFAIPPNNGRNQVWALKSGDKIASLSYDNYSVGGKDDKMLLVDNADIEYNKMILNSITGTCLEMGDDSGIFTACDAGKPSQKWNIRDGKEFTNELNKRLGVRDGKIMNGTDSEWQVLNNERNKIQLRGGNDDCLAVPEVNNIPKNGQAVISKACNHHYRNIELIDVAPGTGIISEKIFNSATDKCLGEKAKMENCIDTSNQHWTYTSDGLLRNVGTGACINKDRNMVSCDRNQQDHLWNRDNKEFKPRQESGSSLEVDQNSKDLILRVASGNPLQLFDTKGRDVNDNRKLSLKFKGARGGPSDERFLHRREDGLLGNFGFEENTRRQEWNFKESLEYSPITSNEDGLCIEFGKRGINASLEVCNDTDEQKWQVRDTNIKNKKTGKCLRHQFDKIEQDDCSQDYNRRWHVVN